MLSWYKQIVIILQGLDLNEDQWKNLFTLCQDKSLILLVDMAFVGMS